MLIKSDMVFFYNHYFHTLKGIYIPTSDTEYIIDLCIKYINLLPHNISIMEIGGGTGCISISLKKIFPRMNSYVIDNNKLAKKNILLNAKIHNIKIDVEYYDVYKYNAKAKPYQQYDLIVSNPPYLTHSEFICKHLIYKMDDHDRKIDFNNCVGGKKFIENMLKYCKARYVILEISRWQIHNINYQSYKLHESFIPDKDSIIAFVVLASIV